MIIFLPIKLKYRTITNTARSDSCIDIHVEVDSEGKWRLE